MRSSDSRFLAWALLNFLPAANLRTVREPSLALCARVDWQEPGNKEGTLPSYLLAGLIRLSSPRHEETCRQGNNEAVWQRNKFA